MSQITYDKDKVDAFKAAFTSYQNAKTSFKKKIMQFREVIDFMEGNKTLATETSKIGTDGEGYVINENGILIQTPKANDYDSSINSVINIDDKWAFVTNVRYQADNDTPVGETNKLYQVGLLDLSYNQATENDIDDYNKYVSVDNSPDLSDNTDCDMNHLFQCSAKAKMENKSYYGIEGGTDDSGDNSICNCYTFDELPTDTVEERLKQIVIDENKDTAYLAILMDGNFYQIQDSTFSNNYKSFYEYESSHKMITPLIEYNKGGNLNPFVGNGINSIKITELGGNTCLRIK